MKLYILPLGRCGNDKEKVFTPGIDQGVWIDVPIWAALIQSQGLNILLDTGMHPVHIDRPESTFEGTSYAQSIIPRMVEADSLQNRLAETGISPSEIDIVINTHLHFDHAGGNYLFPQATFIVQKEHFEQAIKMPEAFPPKYFLLSGLNYDLISGELTLIPGLEIIRCPGHVPGMQTIIVRLPDTGTIILAGDAISLREHLASDRWDGYWNPKLARTSARRIEAIVKAERGQVFYGHDPEWWNSIKQSPDFYT